MLKGSNIAMWTVFAAYVLLGIAGWLVLPYTAGIIENYMYNDDPPGGKIVLPGAGGERAASGGGAVDRLEGSGNSGGVPRGGGKGGGGGGGAGWVDDGGLTPEQANSDIDYIDEYGRAGAPYW